MVDITKCKEENCWVKERCYRYTAKPSKEWQSYFTESPLQTIDGNNQKCGYFWDNDWIQKSQELMERQ